MLVPDDRFFFDAAGMCDDQAIPGPGRSLRRRFLFCTISSTSRAGRPKKAVFKSVDRLVFAGLYPLVPGVPDALKSLQPDTKVPEALSRRHAPPGPRRC